MDIEDVKRQNKHTNSSSSFSNYEQLSVLSSFISPLQIQYEARSESVFGSFFK